MIKFDLPIGALQEETWLKIKLKTRLRIRLKT